MTVSKHSMRAIPYNLSVAASNRDVPMMKVNDAIRTKNNNSTFALTAKGNRSLYPNVD